MHIDTTFLNKVCIDISKIEYLPETYNPYKSIRDAGEDMINQHIEFLINNQYLSAKKNVSDHGVEWVILSVDKTKISKDFCDEYLDQQLVSIMIENEIQSMFCYSCLSGQLSIDFDSDLIINNFTFGTDYRRYALLTCRQCGQIHTIDIVSDGSILNDLTIKRKPNPFHRFPFIYENISENCLIKNEEEQARLKIDTLFKEIVKSFEDENYILCAIGARAVLEQICKSTGKKAVNLQKFLEKLRNVQIISEDEFNLSVRFKEFVGNTAAHDGIKPNMKELVAFFYLLNHLIEKLFRSADRISNLKEALSKNI